MSERMPDELGARTFKVDKLVRDRIIDKTESDGGTVESYRITDKAELVQRLADKVVEELVELKEVSLDDTHRLTSELADAYEALETLRFRLGIRSEAVQRYRDRKEGQNGAFMNGDVISLITLPIGSELEERFAGYEEIIPKPPKPRRSRKKK